MADLRSKQEFEVGVEFYSFALQEADDSLVPVAYPERASDADEFVSFFQGRVDIRSGGHTHTATLAAEVWDAAPPEDHSRDWEVKGEGEIASQTGELSICEMGGSPGNYIQLGETETRWKLRVYCSGRTAVRDLAQVEVPSYVEHYLVQLWPAD
ncbi:hypothetical protein ACFOSC_26430 [Streptantibioticus rubrisoli]|uniref:Uncharacterized protein n=1 Tax=Streptantibioticus rubrisoli TaxID=1387313 RepID=A0ABT1PEM5_9ACTN|nr:hypothetical protein [Streptantibioticus rubrisoli]MCQ4043784.1 hypothetical protein [Streptantibioticus rubrisoli]